MITNSECEVNVDEFRSLLSTITRIPSTDIATWTVVIGIAGAGDVAVIPAPSVRGDGDVRETIHLLTAGIDHALEAIAVNPDD